METKYKITIPQPCHEDWNQMTPDETGRFCSSCAKSVVDFTGMKAIEIQDYFIKTQGQNVCGRFKTQQLDTIIIQIPREVLFSQVQFHKIFMLALLISMGTILFSCQSDGHRKKIDGVEVVDSPQHGMATGGAMVKLDTTKIDTVCDPKAHVAKGITATSGIVEITPIGKPKEKDFYNTNELDLLPAYPGGIKEFYQYVSSNLNLSEQDKKTKQRFIIRFIIEKDGSVSTVRIVRGGNESLNSKVIKILKASPKWTPGELKGKVVRSSYMLPVVTVKP
jgi:hypothetical protein